jgi:peptide/nickel transport system permease protein
VSTFLAYLRQRPGSGVAIGVLVVLALVSLFAPIVAPHDPNQTNLIRQFEPPSGLSFFGTDELGRDLFSRVLYGGQTALLTALGAVVLASLVGFRSVWSAAISVAGSTRWPCAWSTCCWPFRRS